MATSHDVSRLLNLDVEVAELIGFVPLVRNGFSKRCFKGFVEGKEIAETIAKLPAFEDIDNGDAGTLSSEASECLLRIARIYAEATELLGDEAKVAKWLMTRSLTLGEQIPLELLDTSVGFELVFLELQRLQYGIAG